MNVSDADVEKALRARVPGGAEVWHWLPQSVDNNPNETARNVMRAALEAVLSSQPEGWQPISSAPKDGRPLLLYDPTRKEPYQCGMWLPPVPDVPEGPLNYGAWWLGDGREIAEPTHWRPLPAAPEERP